MLRLLPIYEELGLAHKEVEKIADKATRVGTLLVLSKLRAEFEKDGLMPMKLVGEKPDPFRHEVAFRESSELPEGSIVRVVKQGYLFKGEVLQHALVSVSSGKKDGKKDEEADAGGAKKGENPPGAQEAENGKSGDSKT
jgi:molecular chaperone GrpE